MTEEHHHHPENGKKNPAFEVDLFLEMFGMYEGT